MRKLIDLANNGWMDPDYWPAKFWTVKIIVHSPNSRKNGLW